jgi:methyl-accepting chemotaxis protein/sigma-B regulation protein RsbU (phosphoserine phosphatase)
MMAYFSRQALRQETVLEAEEALKGTAQHVDNILFSVEQSTGNIYSELLNHLDQPERMYTYSRRLVECNPYITGCAICFKPNYYPGRELFMAYVHYKDGIVKNGASNLVTSETYGNKPYTEYVWYKMPMTTRRPYWTDPQKEEGDEGLTISFCLPISDKNKECVGVLVADLSVELFSQHVLADKPSPRVYNVLLGSNGSFIVHPDPEKLTSQTVFTLTADGANPTVQKAAEAMMAGETGYMPFRLDDHDWYVFYKPFQQSETRGRSMERLKWSIGTIYSDEEIFNTYNLLIVMVLVIAVLGLLLFYLCSRIVTRRQMRSLRQLTYITQRITQEHYDDPVPNVRRNDEIGQLYEHFQLMKQSLTTHVNELDELTQKLKRHHEVMHEVYAKQQSIDRVMSSFLHYVTDQMLAPSGDIERYVTSLCTNYRSLAPEEISLVVDSINKKSEAITGLINHMLNTAENEATHD